MLRNKLIITVLSASALTAFPALSQETSKADASFQVSAAF
jgi:hypothetical protein